MLGPLPILVQPGHPLGLVDKLTACNLGPDGCRVLREAVGVRYAGVRGRGVYNTLCNGWTLGPAKHRTTAAATISQYQVHTWSIPGLVRLVRCIKRTLLWLLIVHLSPVGDVLSNY